MRKIKLFPAPHTELRLDVSDEMDKELVKEPGDAGCNQN